MKKSPMFAPKLRVVASVANASGFKFERASGIAEDVFSNEVRYASTPTPPYTTKSTDEAAPDREWPSRGIQFPAIRDKRTDISEREMKG
jgi:hypothetical protein